MKPKAQKQNTDAKPKRKAKEPSGILYPKPVETWDGLEDWIKASAKKQKKTL